MCRRNPLNAKTRKCEDEGFDNLKKPRKIDDASLEYTFCPAKATWYEGLNKLYEECKLAMHTGILPNTGSFDEQDSLFVEAFPAFVDRWKERNYKRIWDDVRDFVEPILKAFAGKK